MLKTALFIVKQYLINLLILIRLLNAITVHTAIMINFWSQLKTDPNHN